MGSNNKFVVSFLFTRRFSSTRLLPDSTRSTVAVRENYSLVIYKKIFVGWELVVYPSNADVFPVVASLCRIGNMSAFAGYSCCA